jgi:hypothetical protein
MYLTGTFMFLNQACSVHLRASVRVAKTRNMKIHSTPYACYVSLRNGLTLELTFAPEPRYPRASARVPEPYALRSSGVWMFREEVLLEVRVGLA